MTWIQLNNRQFFEKNINYSIEGIEGNVRIIYDKQMTAEHRYLLSFKRELCINNDNKILFILLNPSNNTFVKTTSLKLDETVKFCFLKGLKEGYDIVEIINVFSHLSPNSDKLMQKLEIELRNTGIIDHKNNNLWIKKSLSTSDALVVSWGGNGNWFNRNVDIINIIRKYWAREIKCLAETKNGYPIHSSVQSRNQFQITLMTPLKEYIFI